LNPRLNRLESDYRELRRRFDGDPNIIIQPNGMPPERYTVVYKVPSLRRSTTNEVVVVDQTVVQIVLPATYPKERPFVTSIDVVFHPNFGTDQAVCIADWWSPARSLADIFAEIGEMLQMRKYNVQSPLNAQAAEWAVINEKSLPIGKVDLGINEVPISIGKVISEDRKN
jgi:ubiquitin-protein ligase